MKQKGFSPQDIADLWGVSRKTVLRAIRRGDLPAIWISPQSIRIMPVDASAYYLKKSVNLSPVVIACSRARIAGIQGEA